MRPGPSNVMNAAPAMSPHDPRATSSPAPAAARRAPIPFAAPFLGDEELEEAVAALRSGWLTTGPRARQFEEEFAAFVDADSAGAPATTHALALNSCSAGLHAARHVLGVGPGDAVITTPLTFAATAHAVEHVGARVVLADIDPHTLTLSPGRAADAVAQARRDGLRPRALLTVHYAGHPADVAALEDLARAEGLAVVEDAAHALPAAAAGRRIGAPSRRGVVTFASFSFYANKNVTTGDGGMLTGPADLLSAARTFCHHGMDRAVPRDPARAPWQYEIVDAGHKYGMTDVAAAVGIHQLRRLPATYARRREIAARYLRAFADADALELPVEQPGMQHAWHLFVVRLRLDRLRIDRDRFLAELGARGIGSSVHYLPVHMHPWYRERLGHAPDAFPVTWDAWPRLASLPLHPGLTDDDVDDVAGAVLDIARAFRR